MTDDIVARLRLEEHWTIGLCDQAADEIERLNAELARIRKLDTKAFANWQKREDALHAETERLREALQRANASLEYYERKFYLGTDRIVELEAALQKYADEEYNGYNACGKHARAALGEKKDG